jgi:hypothetical protein
MDMTFVSAKLTRILDQIGVGLYLDVHTGVARVAKRRIEPLRLPQMRRKEGPNPPGRRQL